MYLLEFALNMSALILFVSAQFRVLRYISYCAYFVIKIMQLNCNCLQTYGNDEFPKFLPRGLVEITKLKVFYTTANKCMFGFQVK